MSTRSVRVQNLDWPPGPRAGNSTWHRTGYAVRIARMRKSGVRIGDCETGHSSCWERGPIAACCATSDFMHAGAIMHSSRNPADLSAGSFAAGQIVHSGARNPVNPIRGSSTEGGTYPNPAYESATTECYRLITPELGCP